MASDDARATPLARIRVLMLVRNSGEFDTRVRKEATTLAALGFHVRVLALASDGLPDRDIIGEVEYERIHHRAWLLMAGRDRYVQAQAALKDRYLARVATIRDLGHARIDAHVRRVVRINALADALDARLPGAQRVPPPLTSERTVLTRIPIRLLKISRRAAVRFSWTMRRARRLQDHRRIVMARMWLSARRLLLLVVWAGVRRVHKRLLPVRYHLDYWRSALPAMERFAPHVVHSHDLNTLYVARRYSRRHRLPLVYDAHELELHRNAVWTRPKRIVARVVETLGIRTATAVITVSPDIAHDLATTYRINRPVVVLNSPPLESRQLDPPFSLRAVAGLSESDSLVVYVGAVARGRGIEQLVDALAYLPANCHVGLLGPRSADRDEKLVTRAEALGVAERLHLFAPLPSPLVPAALAEAAVSVIPIQNVCRSYDLALPNKLFDAVMAGVPLAVGDLVGMRNFVTRYGLGDHFDEKDPRSIASTLRRLMKERPVGLLDAQSLDALQRSICWEEQEHNLRSIYERITRLLVSEGVVAG